MIYIKGIKLIFFAGIWILTRLDYVAVSMVAFAISQNLVQTHLPSTPFSQGFIGLLFIGSLVAILSWHGWGFLLTIRIIKFHPFGLFATITATAAAFLAVRHGLEALSIAREWNIGILVYTIIAITFSIFTLYLRYKKGDIWGKSKDDYFYEEVVTRQSM